MPRKVLPSVKLGAAIDEYLTKLRSDSDPAHTTLTSKRRTLRILTKHATRGEHTLTRNLREHHFTDTLLDLRDGASDGENDYLRRLGKGRRTGRSEKTMRADRATLRQFATFLRWRKYVAPDFDPTYAIATVARPIGSKDVKETHQFKRIPEHEWASLLDACWHPRDRWLIAANLYWARRASDLVMMDWRHLHLEASDDYPLGWVELFNVKKGRRVGAGPLPIYPALRRELDRYLEWFVSQHGEPQLGQPMFPAKVGIREVPTLRLESSEWPLAPDRRMTAAQVSQLAHEMLEAWWGPGADVHREGSHTLRRSGGRWVAINCGLDVAQRLLDHSTQAQTRVYVGWSQEDETLSDFMRGPTQEPPKAEPVSPPEADETPMAIVVDMFSRKRVA